MNRDAQLLALELASLRVVAASFEDEWRKTPQNIRRLILAKTESGKKYLEGHSIWRGNE